MKSIVYPLSIAVLSAACSSPTTEQATTASDTVEVASTPATQEAWQPLFNHENLDGWDTMPGGEWRVEDGVIVGASPASDERHGILISQQEYDDFKLRVVYKANQGNSGLYFRVEKVGEPYNVAGFQAEIDPEKDAGGLYETSGRAWVVQPDPEDVKTWYKPNEWNEMIVVAKGKDIAVYVNGQKTAEVKDDPGREKGYIGVQLHGGQDMDIRFKDIEIIENPASMEI